ncbi:MAG TPA: hydroxymethylbilane synthase [Sedimentisphaerales bacterium]|nr:hydroxymethylbilane synthase [Sedimentisphaerales bacterium]
MPETLTVATRGGKLAIAQTQILIAALKRVVPDLQIEMKKITTSGDRDRRTALWKLQTTGFFTSQVEDALLARRADLAVHSLKDLPTRPRDGLTIAAVCERQFPEDCLIAAEPVTCLEQLKPSAKIGTSSPRRIAQLRHLRPDLQPTDIRGNVTTRIKKLEHGRYDAIILARAGLERLGLTDRISFCFDPRQFLPAAAQGALALQARADNTPTIRIAAAIDDPNSRAAACAERQVLAAMQCGCHAPAGVFARIDGDDITIDAFISDLEAKEFIRRKITGPVSQARSLAQKLAHELLNAAGPKIRQNLQL